MALVPMAVAVGYLLCCPWFALVEDDSVSLGQPLVTDCFNQFYSGRLPLWSDHTGCGHPLAARYWMLLYPPLHAAHWLGRLAGIPAREILIAYVLHLGFAAFTAFLYLRSLAVSRVTSATAAIAYALAGPMMGLATNWSDYAFWLPYVPLGFLCIERLAQGNRSWFWPCFLGLVGSLVYQCSGPVGTIKFGLLVGMYFLLRAKRTQFLFALSRLAVASLLILLACAGQMMATYQFLSSTTRLPESGLTDAESLLTMALSPEFYRGFFYPFIEFNWVSGFNYFLYEDGTGRFNGSGVFAGPLAALGVCLAVSLVRERGPHRALLALVAFYFLLSLGYYWQGNLFLHHLPFFRHYRWPVRWTPEFCAVAALLSGVAVEMGWKHRDDRSVLAAIAAYLLLVAFAVTTHTVLATDYQARWSAAALPWLVLTGVVGYLFVTRQRPAFDRVAIVFTVAASIAIVPGAQDFRFGDLRHLTHDPLPYGIGSQERVLYLANRVEQRSPTNEGSYAYNLPHQLGSRTVFTYGPFKLKEQEWADGINNLGEIADEDAAIRAFLRGHLLEGLRVGWVVVPIDNPKLRQACRENRQLRLEAETRSVAVYQNEGFRSPAFFVGEVRPESELSSWAALGQAELSRVCYAGNGYTGPRTWETSGAVSDYVEDNGIITLGADVPGERFLVVTSTWYPGWVARVDGRDVPLYRVNGSFLGVVVPAGKHDLRLEYRPTVLIILFAVNLCVLVALLAYCGIWIFLRLRHDGIDLRSGEAGKP